jgi:hypothetical protein
MNVESLTMLNHQNGNTFALGVGNFPNVFGECCLHIGLPSCQCSVLFGSTIERVPDDIDLAARFVFKLHIGWLG